MELHCRANTELKWESYLDLNPECVHEFVFRFASTEEQAQSRGVDITSHQVEAEA